MRRRLLVATVVVLSVLVGFAPAATAANVSGQLEVASQHTTDANFNSSNELTNVSVEGSGTAANVTLNSGDTTLDSFEDGDISEYGVDTANFSTTSSFATDGSTGLSGTGNSVGDVHRIQDGDLSMSSGNTYRVDLQTQSGMIMYNTFGVPDDSTQDGYRVAVNPVDNRIRLFRIDSGSATTLNTTSAAISGGSNYTLEFDWGSGGSLNATLFDDSDNSVASATASDSTYTSGGIVFRLFADTQTGSVYWDNLRELGTGTAPEGTYRSATHNAEKVEEGFTNLTLTNASATVEWRTDTDDDGTFETVVNSSTYTTDGNKTLVLNTQYDDWRANVTFSNDSGSPTTAKLHDEGVLFNASAPSGSNLDPADGSQVNNYDGDISLDVNDSDFGLAQGDSVTVTAKNKTGSQIGQTTITSNQTVTFSHTAEVGENNITWTLEDSYGPSTTVEQNFTTPSELEIRLEGDPDQLANTVTVNVTSYYGDEVERTTVSNGKVDLSGFPTDQAIIARINGSGYYVRTVVIEDIFAQQEVYILNKSTDTHLVRFELQDLTGNYPDADTVLFVERDLNRSGNVEWRTIAGDNFGVRGVPVYLRQDERYRIKIKNLETGDTAVIGAYTAIQNETVTVSTGGASISIPPSEKEYDWAIVENESGQYIQFKYNDTEGLTDQINLTIHERFNKSNVLVDNNTFSTNDLTYQKSLTQDEVNKTWMAELYIDRGDGFQHFRVPIGNGGISILPGGIDAVWMEGIGVFIMLVAALAFSELNLGVGAITTALVGATLWWFGILSTIATGPGVVIALFIALVYHHYTPSGGGDI